MKAHDSRAIANIFVQKARDAGDMLTIMQLVKFVYFAHGWTLGNTGQPLIKHKVEAWRYGPVIPEVYNAFRAQGVIIKYLAIDDVGEPYKTELDEVQQKVVDSVYDGYSVMPTFKLSNITHRPDSPWSEYGKRGMFRWTIPNEKIQAYYAKLIAEVKNNGG